MPRKLTAESQAPSYDVFMGLFIQGEQYQPKFRHFDILEMIGEGSFGRVFKVKHKDSGVVMAMKAMKKQFLVQNQQLKYAVSEARIMQMLSSTSKDRHPYILKLFFTFQVSSFGTIYVAFRLLCFCTW